MKNSREIIGLATGVALLGLALGAFAHGNEPGAAQATVGGAKVSITFRRPTLKGRDLMSLVHPGDLWRMGADINTTLETDGDLDFGGTRVPKGKYFLLARYVSPGQWTLVVSNKDRRSYDPSAKVAEVPMKAEKAADSVEAMNITLTPQGEGAVLEVAWGTDRLSASFDAAK